MLRDGARRRFPRASGEHSGPLAEAGGEGRLAAQACLRQPPLALLRDVSRGPRCSYERSAGGSRSLPRGAAPPWPASACGHRCGLGRPVRNQSSMNRSGAAAGPVSIRSMPKGLPIRLDHARLEDGPSLLVGRSCAGSNGRQGGPNAKVGSSACWLLARTVSSERFGGACSLAQEIRQRRARLRPDWVGMAALPVRHPARFRHLAGVY